MADNTPIVPTEYKPLHDVPEDCDHPGKFKSSSGDDAGVVKKLVIAIILCTLFMAGEVAGGYFSGSLAIMTDAAHMLSDVTSFAISLGAVFLTRRKATAKHTYGFHRAEILGALVSVLIIWMVTAVLVYEAVNRVITPTHVEGKLMFIVAASGFGVNILLGVVLGHPGHAHSHAHGGDEKGHSHESVGSNGLAKGHSHGGSINSAETEADLHGKSKTQDNINVRAAVIHVIGDLIQSGGVMIAGGLIWWKPQWHLADPITTFIFSVLVMGTTIRLVKESITVLMEGTPAGFDTEKLEQRFMEIPGVTMVHDLHVWQLTAGKLAVTVHIASTTPDPESVLEPAQKICWNEFAVFHTTIQVERSKEGGGDHCHPCE